MTYDGSNRKHIRQAEKQAKIAEAQRRNFVKSIMAQYDGRAWMHELLVRCHIFRTSFVAGRPDVTSFQLGEQNIGLQTFNDVVALCPNEYVLMMNEANAKEVIDDRRYSESGLVTAGPTGGSEDTGRDVAGQPAAGEDPGAEEHDGWVN